MSMLAPCSKENTLIPAIPIFPATTRNPYIVLFGFVTVAELTGSYKTNTIANGERFVTYVAPQFMLAITGSSSGSAIYLGNINFLSKIVNTLDNVSVTIHVGHLSIQNDSGGTVRYSILLPS